MKKIICHIGARGGSKGVKGKNCMPICGLPLIAWSVKQALECPYIEKVIVSTDSIEIAEIAKKYGADVPFIRPKKLASDSAGKWEVWQHALNFLDQNESEKIDIFLDLDCTSPLRDVEDITNAINLFNDNDVDVVFSVCEARKNPYFNMVEENDKGFLKISKQINPIIKCRQDAPKVFEHVASIYVLSPDYIRNSDGLLSGKTKGYDMAPAKCYDIDSEFDYEIVEYLMNKKLKQE